MTISHLPARSREVVFGDQLLLVEGAEGVRIERLAHDHGLSGIHMRNEYRLRGSPPCSPSPPGDGSRSWCRRLAGRRKAADYPTN
jgi:hypothetical protein